MNYLTADEVKKIFSKDKFSDLFLKSRIIHEALENGNFFLEYQPKISILEESLGEVKGLEALLRLKYKGEIIQPGIFIDYCEKNKLIIPIGAYVIEQIAKDMVNWRSQNSNIVPCSVNITQEQLHLECRSMYYDPSFSFAKQASIIMEKYKLSNELLEFEMIERDTSSNYNEIIFEVVSKILSLQKKDISLNFKSILENIQLNSFKRITFDDVLPFLKEINSEGFILSIDDYGKGMHNTNTLTSNLFSILKLDKTTIDLIPKVLSKNTMPLEFRPFYDFLHYKKNYCVSLVAEGVESFEQLNFLRTIGVTDNFNMDHFDMVQGYYFSKPISKEKIPAILKPGYFSEYFKRDMNSK